MAVDEFGWGVGDDVADVAAGAASGGHGIVDIVGIDLKEVKQFNSFLS